MHEGKKKMKTLQSRRVLLQTRALGDQSRRCRGFPAPEEQHRECDTRLPTLLERRNGEGARKRKRRIVLLEIVTDRKSRFLTQHHISASAVRIGMQNFFLAEKCNLRFSTLRPCRAGFGRQIRESRALFCRPQREIRTFQ